MASPSPTSPISSPVLRNQTLHYPVHRPSSKVIAPQILQAASKFRQRRPQRTPTRKHKKVKMYFIGASGNLLSPSVPFSACLGWKRLLSCACHESAIGRSIYAECAGHTTSAVCWYDRRHSADTGVVEA